MSGQPGLGAKAFAFGLPTLIALGVGGGYLVVSDHLEHRGSFTAVQACDVVTQPDIDRLFGPGYVRSVLSLPGETDGDITATVCLYHTQTASIDDSQEVEVDVRAARTRTGSDRNEKQFDHPLPGTTPVPGLGERAYWVEKPGALMIFENHNWYTLWAGPTRAGRPRSPDLSEKLARTVLGRM